MSKYLTYFPNEKVNQFTDEELTLLAVVIAQSHVIKGEYRVKCPMLPYSSIGTSKSWCKMWSKIINRLIDKKVMRWVKSTVYIKCEKVPFKLHSNDELAEAQDNLTYPTEGICCFWTNKYSIEAVNKRFATLRDEEAIEEKS